MKPTPPHGSFGHSTKRNLHIVPDQPARPPRRALPTIPRRKPRLQIVSAGAVARTHLSGEGRLLVASIGAAGLILVLCTMLIVHFSATQSSPARAPLASRQVARVTSFSISPFVPALRDTRTGLHALSAGSTRQAEAALDRAATESHLAQAETRSAVHAPIPAGVDRYVQALDRARGAIHRGNLFAALAAANQIGEAEADMLLITGPPSAH